MKKRSEGQGYGTIGRSMGISRGTVQSIVQRELAEALGFSLGKLNYCLQALKSKGLIKINNFKKSENKINYIYVLTPKGITQKTKLTINFMRKKVYLTQFS